MRSILAVASMLAFFAPAFAQQSPPLELAWKDLLNADEAKATKAALAFAANPKESAAFLQKNLRPVKADAKTVAKLVGQLGDNDFATREEAQLELEYLGKFAKADLTEVKKTTENAEVKERVTKLLGRIEAVEKEESIQKEEPKPMNQFGGGGGVSIRSVNGVTQIYINGKLVDTTAKVIEKLPPSATWVRAGRAIGVLEFLGTPEAISLLEQLSLGEDNAGPTKQAQDALARLKRKK